MSKFDKVNQYNRDTYRTYTLRVNREKDAEISEHLDRQESVNGYILDLIRKDIHAGVKTFDLVTMGADNVYRHAAVDRTLYDLMAYWDHIRRGSWIKAAYIIRRVNMRVIPENGSFTQRGEIIAKLTV